MRLKCLYTNSVVYLDDICDRVCDNRATPHIYIILGLSLLCSKFYLLFFPEVPKIFTYYSYFIPIAPPIIPLYSIVSMLITMQE